MFDRDLRRTTTAGLRVLLALAEERGMAAAEGLAGTTLTRGDTECTVHQELVVIRNLLARFGTEVALGAEAGSRTGLPLAGPWGLALLSSRTLRDGFDVATRYLDRVFVSGRLTAEQSGGEIRLRFDDSENPAHIRAFLAERILTGAATVCTQLFDGEISPIRLEFRHAAPPDTRRYREICGVEPLFGARTDVVIFHSRGLDAPMPRNHERARGDCAQLCRDLLHRRQPRSGVAGSVRDLLVRNPGELPDQIAVANELFMSPRTLSRRLNEEATSFRALLDEVRQLLSEQLLTYTDMSTEQVAARLGYAEAASFIRAFRRWKGCPPQEFRLHEGRSLPREVPVPAGVR
ncbi:AraC family transcriptional regulator [Nocardia brasiliensis]|uniref:AraC family transcriptional regulator n=1 Tax=Nocardia brasiliensis TaxID=37326 RepID=UPI0018943CA5|nr:AraC family transcriptional regulator [Nocardia brasiliensis]MBF6543225.1 AraC family transcriptional regulator [Nocardia brasiliensis]